MGHKAPKPDLRCNSCRDDKCEECTDLTRMALHLPSACPCTRKHHARKINDARLEELENEDDLLNDPWLDHEPLDLYE